MGRLMDSVMAAVGLKPSDRLVLISTTTQDNVKNKHDYEEQNTQSTKSNSESGTRSDSDHSHFGSKFENVKYKGANTAITKECEQPTSTEVSMDNVNSSKSENKSPPAELIVASKPVIPDDCVGCRIIGAGVFSFTAGTVFHLAYKCAKQKNVNVIRRQLFLMSGTTGALGLSLLAVMRLFNLGIFDPEKRDWSVEDHLKNDINDAKALLGLLSPVKSEITTK